ncbi:TRAP transporter substrate-binding protein [Sedimentitalea sp. XS_ASV28]|uniref:TRAP transporter substrate-binding protein n=1 Tax=Sedimentitalea sp. XS_ASV28 TaxID=3241296 RepID=UPI0035174012
MTLKSLTLAMLMAIGTPALSEVKIALDSNPDPELSGSYNWIAAFGKSLTDAGLDVREMPRGSIGDEAEKLDQIATGLLEVSLSDVRSVGSIDPFIYGVRLPYIFDDMAHMDRALAEGNVFASINETLASQDVMLVALVPLGPYSGIITTTAAVRSPTDMADLRMRALDDAQLSMYKAWGSSGTVVPWSEVPASLQTGVIDGYLNSAFVPIMFGQTDFVRNFSDARVMIPLRAVLMSRIWYEGLSDEDRNAVDTAVTVGNDAVRDWLAEVSESSLVALEEAGVTVQRLTDAERGVFREQSRSVYRSGLLSDEDVDRWEALTESTR